MGLSSPRVLSGSDILFRGFRILLDCSGDRQFVCEVFIANGVHRPREQHFRPGRILLFALSSSTMVFWLIHKTRISARSKTIGLSSHSRRIWVQFLPRLHPLSFPSVTLEIQLSNISLRMINCNSVVLSSSQLIHRQQMR